MNKVLTYIILGIGVCGLAFAPLLSRLALQEGIAPIPLAFIRLSISGLIILFIILFSKKHRKEITHLTKKQWLIGCAGGFFMGVHFVLWYLALNNTSMFAATLFVNLQPIFMLFIVWIFLHKKPRIAGILSIVIALFGSLMVALGSSGDGVNTIYGDALALAGALFVSVYIFCYGIIRKKISLLVSSFLIFGFGALFLFIATLIMGYPIINYSLATYKYIIGLVIISTLLGHTLLGLVLKYVNPLVVSVSILGECVGALFLGILFFTEIPQTTELIGAFIIIIGILAYNYSEYRLDKRNTKADSNL